MSLCQAPPGELTFLLEAVGPGTQALAAVEPGRRDRTSSARSETATGSTWSGHSWSEAGSASRPSRISPSSSAHRPRSSGFRSDWHAEAAALVPNAEVVVEPTLVTDPLRDLATDCCNVLACGPEPMLEAVRELVPSAQLAWEAPMACGYGACYGCSVEIDGVLQRLCVSGPVLEAA